MNPDDRIALGVLLEHGGAGKPHLFEHFIYVPDESSAASLASALRPMGFDVSTRLSSDDVKWLVLARHLLIPNEEAIELLDQKLGAFAANFGGTYDGWEAEVRKVAREKYQ